MPYMEQKFLVSSITLELEHDKEVLDKLEAGKNG